VGLRGPEDLGRRSGGAVVGCRRFDGRVAVVTGGASGIGEATARRFAAEGADVVVADVDDERGRSVVAAIGAEQAVYVHCDVAVMADWQHLRETAMERWGRVDVLHSNAFVQVAAPAHELHEEDWDRVLAVDLKASYLGTRALVDALAVHEGAIVLTSSVNAIVGRLGRPAYAAAKGGLDALARQLAVEYGPEVRVNSIIVGAIETPAWRDVSDTHRRDSAMATAARRLGHPDEIAAAVAFLASSDASYVTGASLVVDGGWSIMKAGG
jgi:NAD(P)-dependent dehydrogenase (short-subunit alcohol dehydrogenase family)